MTSLWVDADACPNAIKTVIFKAAERRQLATTLVANQYIKPPPSAVIKAIQVPAGFDVADNEILKRMVTGDLVITQDVPLAAEVVEAGGFALNPRGTLYTRENVKDYLARRDGAEAMRDQGEHTNRAKPFDKKDVQAFANALDRFLAQHG
ncbi:YaiI/YqxD family protein [Litorivicinus lipolyticus]|uniref:UPF0178 protein GH975_08350 n=1 Tax=Litorivicinus lipolyticus TaxID=418701 RepID=A0A5Q2Q7R2_9GAMM|nr:YaiI/YqxD family protein [Litorivicinus lipolyticus]QGG80579.1 YaiI/YqxD family protein [Litorivicinus lipolyticus]